MARVEHYDVAEPETYQVGQAPGVGIYRCVEVPSFIVILDDEKDTLPEYPAHPIDPSVDISYRRVVRHRAPHWQRVHDSRTLSRTSSQAVSAN